MTKVLTVKVLKNMLKTLDEDLPVAVYNIDNGERTYLYDTDIDSGTPVVFDINFSTEVRKAETFIEDIVKVNDLLNLSRNEFLATYGYISDRDVSLTINEIKEGYTAFAVWFFIKTQQTLANDAMGIDLIAVKGTELMNTFINKVLPKLDENQTRRFWEIVNSKRVDVDKKYTFKDITSLVCDTLIY